MEYKYLDVRIHYIIEGEGDPIILLHGWGQSLHTFDSLIEVLKKKYLVYALDLPGFGYSDEPEGSWSTDDYSKMLNSFCEDLYISKPIVLGHSFGGRIAIKYASTYNNINKLILVDSAGVNVNRGIRFYLKRWYYKLVKYYYQLTKNEEKVTEWFDKHASADYKNATDNLRNTFKKIVNEDLTKELKKIEAETLLIWGENDSETPIECAVKMQKKIPDAGLVRLEGLGHFPYLEDKKWFNIILMNYLDIK